METIQDVPVPVLCQVDSLATAAGCQLVASCDIAVASTNASFCTPGSVKLWFFMQLFSIFQNLFKWIKQIEHRSLSLCFDFN